MKVRKVLSNDEQYYEIIEGRKLFKFKTDDSLMFFIGAFMSGFFGSDPSGHLEIYYKHTDAYERERRRDSREASQDQLQAG